MESVVAHHSSKIAPAERARWVRWSLWLVAGTMAYNAVEAGVALWAGLRAESSALVGFGLDSIIEIAAAGVLLWRMLVQVRGAGPEAVEQAERKVRRFIGITFFALAGYILGESGWTLWTDRVPSESVLGVLLAIASLIIMPLIAWGKFRAGGAISSGALRAEAKETLACSYLSLCLLLGLGANALAGWWWADPVAAIMMVPWLVREGMDGIKAETAPPYVPDSSAKHKGD